LFAYYRDGSGGEWESAIFKHRLMVFDCMAVSNKKATRRFDTTQSRGLFQNYYKLIAKFNIEQYLLI